MAADNPDLEVTFVLSDPHWEWTGRIGYAQDHLEGLLAELTERDVYVWWVPPMVVQAKERLAELCASDERVHSEDWEESVVTAH